jgi:hypothetical protein
MGSMRLLTMRAALLCLVLTSHNSQGNPQSAAALRKSERFLPVPTMDGFGIYQALADQGVVQVPGQTNEVPVSRRPYLHFSEHI